MATRMFTMAERPELSEGGIPDELVWPEYNLHGAVTSRLWPRLHEDLPRFQFGLYDEDTGQLVAQGHTVPCWWDGTDEGLSTGLDETLQAALTDHDAGGPTNTLCAVAAAIPPHARGQGLSRAILEAMAAIARRAGLDHLIAPVRPSMKERYPITPIERYVTWRRTDGRLFDPWMRVHESLGARVGPPLPRSLQIIGTVGEWEAWTGLAFPDSGAFVFLQGLAPMVIDREVDVGTYWEPNVWMIHR